MILKHLEMIVVTQKRPQQREYRYGLSFPKKIRMPKTTSNTNKITNLRKEIFVLLTKNVTSLDKPRRRKMKNRYIDEPTTSPDWILTNAKVARVKTAIEKAVPTRTRISLKASLLM